MKVALIHLWIAKTEVSCIQSWTCHCAAGAQHFTLQRYSFSCGPQSQVRAWHRCICQISSRILSSVVCRLGLCIMYLNLAGWVMNGNADDVHTLSSMKATNTDQST